MLFYKRAFIGAFVFGIHAYVAGIIPRDENEHRLNRLIPDMIFAGTWRAVDNRPYIRGEFVDAPTGGYAGRKKGQYTLYDVGAMINRPPAPEGMPYLAGH